MTARETRDVPTERGAGSVLAVAIIGSVVALLALAVPLYIGLAIRESVADAADAAALAAADVAVGIAPGFPCATAGQVARANGADLAACQIDGEVVTVRLQHAFFGIELASTSTAGPPDAVTN